MPHPLSGKPRFDCPPLWLSMDACVDSSVTRYDEIQRYFLEQEGELSAKVRQAAANAGCIELLEAALKVLPTVAHQTGEMALQLLKKRVARQESTEWMGVVRSEFEDFSLVALRDQLLKMGRTVPTHSCAHTCTREVALFAAHCLHWYYKCHPDQMGPLLSPTLRSPLTHTNVFSHVPMHMYSPLHRPRVPHI